MLSITPGSLLVACSDAVQAKQWAFRITFRKEKTLGGVPQGQTKLLPERRAAGNQRSAVADVCRTAVAHAGGLVGPEEVHARLSRLNRNYVVAEALDVTIGAGRRSGRGVSGSEETTVAALVGLGHGKIRTDKDGRGGCVVRNTPRRRTQTAGNAIPVARR